MSELRVTMAHVHASGMCSRGAAAKLKSLGYERKRIMDILKNGIPITEAQMLGDGQMNILIAKALAQAKEERNRG